MPWPRNVAPTLVALAVVIGLSRPASADPCDTSSETPWARGCPRFLTPAFVATSSTQSFVNLGISGGWRRASGAAFAGEPGQSLSQVGVTGSPSVGGRITPFALLYAGTDGSATAGVNVGSLVGQGAIFSGDYYLGMVLQAHSDNWRIALNGRLLRGSGDVIEAGGIVEGVSANFTNSGIVQALQTLSKGIGDVIEPYTVTTGRLDLAAAYDSGSVTLQLAVGGEGIRDDFSPEGPNLVQRIVTTALPRVGLAVGLDPNKVKSSWKSPVEFLFEYQITVNRSWLEVSGQAGSIATTPVTDSVVALGIYTARSVRPDLELGLAGFYEFGAANNLLATGTQALAQGLAQQYGGVTSFRYFF